ncbi:MAG: hypothetical protein ACI9LV_000965 [Candidatus Nanohaloarchaea archaeon]|jgi:hypothetical protein
MINGLKSNYGGEDVVLLEDVHPNYGQDSASSFEISETRMARELQAEAVEYLQPDIVLHEGFRHEKSVAPVREAIENLNSSKDCQLLMWGIDYEELEEAKLARYQEDVKGRECGEEGFQYSLLDFERDAVRLEMIDEVLSDSPDATVLAAAGDAHIHTLESGISMQGYTVYKQMLGI